MAKERELASLTKLTVSSHFRICPSISVDNKIDDRNSCYLTITWFRYSFLLYFHENIFSRLSCRYCLNRIINTHRIPVVKNKKNYRIDSLWYWVVVVVVVKCIYRWLRSGILVYRERYAGPLSTNWRYEDIANHVSQFCECYIYIYI